MNDNEKIMDKLDKLLRLSESPNENEAYAAAQKAQELFVKYNISRGDINRAQAGKRRVIQKSTGITFTAMTDPWVITLASTVANNHRCKAFRYQNKHARKITVGFIGFEDDFAFCLRIFRYAYYCVMERKQDIRTKRKGTYTAGQLREAGNAYGAGFVVGLKALYDKQREAHQEWGLVLVTPTEVEAVERQMINPKSFWKAPQREHEEEFQRGMKDGLEFDPTNKLAG